MSYEENSTEKKQLDPKIVELRRLYEAAKPKSLTETQRKNNVRQLFEYIKPEFEKLIRRPDGSRAAQLVFHRGDEQVRSDFLAKLNPILIQIAQSRYQYRIALAIIKDSTKQQRDQIFEALYGEYSNLIKHRYGCIVLDSLYERINREQKNKLLFEVCWNFKENKKLSYDKIKKYNFKSTSGSSDESGPRGITFDEICTIAQQVYKDMNKNNKVKSQETSKSILDWTVKTLNFACDKNLSQFKVVQALILLVGEYEPSKLGEYLIHINDIAYSYEGSRVVLLGVQNATQEQLRATIKLIEPHERKNLVDPNAPQAAEQEEGEQNGEEEQDQEAAENAEENQEKNAEENQEENAEDNGDGNAEGNGEEEEELFELNNTCKLATGEYSWRVLSACISYINDKSVVIEEVIPNLFDMWPWIRKNKYVQQLLYRIFEKTGSVFCGIDFQGPNPISPELCQCLFDFLLPNLGESIDSLYEYPQGSDLIICCLEHALKSEDKKNFDSICEMVFTKENIQHKVGNKLVKRAIQRLGSDVVPRVRKIIHHLKLENVLRTPGAHVVAELCERDAEYRQKAIKAIEENEIQKDKAIMAILEPKSQSEKKDIILNNRHRAEKKDKAKRQSKK